MLLSHNKIICKTILCMGKQQQQEPAYDKGEKNRDTNRKIFSGSMLWQSP